jgi:hypothetical protein
MLTVAGTADQSEFEPIKSTFASMPPAKSMSELASAGAETGGEMAAQAVGTPGQAVPRPSTQYRDISGGQVFQASVPDNWTPLASKSAIKVVPQNGYGQVNGQAVFTHGIEFGVARASSRSLPDATKAWLNAVAQGNPELRLDGEQQAMKISNRSAIATPLVNPSPLGGREKIGVYTVFLADGNLFYYITVVPEADSQAYNAVFERIGRSLKLTDVR